MAASGDKKGETPRGGRPADAAEPWARAAAGDTAAGRPPAPSSAPSTPASQSRSTGAEVADFLSKVKGLGSAATTGTGRLLFAMDATMSRQPTWDLALALQADMFRTVRSIGGLDVQLVYFRGFDECRASRWVGDAEALARLMTTVQCRGGHTQIGRVLGHARREMEKARIHAMVYVGDAFEEDIDDVCRQAGELALLGLPVFLFQEGRDARAEVAFREIARLTRGAWCPFDAGSAEQLRALLSAVAAYAAGGRKALERLADGAQSAGARLLLERMKPA